MQVGLKFNQIIRNSNRLILIFLLFKLNYGVHPLKRIWEFFFIHLRQSTQRWHQFMTMYGYLESLIETTIKLIVMLKQISNIILIFQNIVTVHASITTTTNPLKYVHHPFTFPLPNPKRHNK